MLGFVAKSATSQVTVSNNNTDGWSTGVVVLILLIICSMALAIFGNLIGLISNDRFWGSVHAGQSFCLLLGAFDHQHPTQIVRS